MFKNQIFLYEQCPEIFFCSNKSDEIKLKGNIIEVQTSVIK